MLRNAKSLRPQQKSVHSESEKIDMMRSDLESQHPCLQGFEGCGV